MDNFSWAEQLIWAKGKYANYPRLGEFKSSHHLEKLVKIRYAKSLQLLCAEATNKRSTPQRHKLAFLSWLFNRPIKSFGEIEYYELIAVQEYFFVRTLEFDLLKESATKWLSANMPNELIFQIRGIKPEVLK